MLQLIVFVIIMCIFLVILFKYLKNKLENQDEIFQSDLAKLIIRRISDCPDNKVEINAETGIYNFGSVHILIENGDLIVKQQFRYNLKKALRDKIRQAIDNKIISNLEKKV